jgi:hypothetical protein
VALETARSGRVYGAEYGQELLRRNLSCNFTGGWRRWSLCASCAGLPIPISCWKSRRSRRCNGRTRGSAPSHGPIRPGSISHYGLTTSMRWSKVAATTAWVHSEGNRGCISWPLSGPSEPPCRTAAIDRSCTTCAARGRSGSSVTADKPVRVKASRSAWPVPCETAAGRSGI